MKPEVIEYLRWRWLRLRIYRYRGSFPVAYRILRNYIRIEAKREHQNES
ncbi:TPA: YlcG family protein [Citrobacter farmeri]|nr:YlcG family protein [Citrobacter farmeri]HAT2778955.1 YlcG family protein [Citrobacter farmeri]HAT2809961.1 YlcG family protein [Citrobacter farmeri]HBC0549778.1 YlcG family protein [Citrobacter farmeri]